MEREGGKGTIWGLDMRAGWWDLFRGGNDKGQLGKGTFKPGVEAHTCDASTVQGLQVQGLAG